jgi:acetylornithine deacetylase
VCAGKGYSLATITIRGKEAHSAFPSKGHSAIYDAARVLLGLEQIARDLETNRDTAFDPPFTTLNVGTIEGGTAKNIIPGECRLLVEWRPIPSQPADYVTGLLSQEIARLQQSVPGLEAELHVQRMDPAFAPSKPLRLRKLTTSRIWSRP